MRPPAEHLPAVGSGPRSPLRRAALAGWTVMVVALGLLAAPPGGADTPAAVDLVVAADDALDWISTQLDANEGTMPGFGPGTTDWGLTADAVLALAAGGRAEAATTVRAADLIAGSVDVFTTWAPAMPEVRDAGVTAKALLAMRMLGRSGVLDGTDLEAELRALMVIDGGDAGRFVDSVPEPGWNTANAFGQSFAMLALGSTSNGVPPASTSYVLSQQCPSGGFPLDHAAGGCLDDSLADTDATALVLQVLLGVERTGAVTESLTAGVAWLRGRQDPVTGAVGGTGPTAGHNTNSTGLVAQTLRAAGDMEAADRAAAWIVGYNQLTEQNAADGPAAADIGAIAYDPSALSSALGSGIPSQRSDQWRRSTTQAVLALGLPPYGNSDVEPLVDGPATTTTTTMVTRTTDPTTTTTTTDSTTTMGASVAPPADDDTPGSIGPTGPDRFDVLGTGGVGSRDTEGNPADVLVDTTAAGSTPGGRADRSHLARTGSTSGSLIIVGLALVAVGLTLGPVRRLGRGPSSYRRSGVIR